jgi:hypothetical protein
MALVEQQAGVPDCRKLPKKEHDLFRSIIKHYEIKQYKKVRGGVGCCVGGKGWLLPFSFRLPPPFWGLSIGGKRARYFMFMYAFCRALFFSNRASRRRTRS